MYFANNYCIITTKLTLILAEKCKVKNVNSHKYPSKIIQDTQNNFDSSSSNLALIINGPK